VWFVGRRLSEFDEFVSSKANKSNKESDEPVSEQSVSSSTLVRYDSVSAASYAVVREERSRGTSERRGEPNGTRTHSSLPWYCLGD